MSVSGGGQQTGGITVSAGSTIQLSGVNTSLWTSARWEIYGYPPGWATPSGWTLDATTGNIYYTGTTPPLITLPASGSTSWGKWLVRLIVNGGTKNGVAPTFDPVTGSYLPNDVIDIASGWQVLEPSTQATEVARFEGTQFGGLARWIGPLQTALRAIISMITGVVQALFGPTKAQVVSGVERLTTTSTTPVSCAGAGIYTMPDNTGVDCVLTVRAKLAGSASEWGQDYYVSYTRSGTAPTIDGTLQNGSRTLPSSLTGVSATVAVVGNTLVPKVTDATGGRTINWSVAVQYQPVSD